MQDRTTTDFNKLGTNFVPRPLAVLLAFNRAHHSHLTPM